MYVCLCVLQVDEAERDYSDDEVERQSTKRTSSRRRDRGGELIQCREDGGEDQNLEEYDGHSLVTSPLTGRGSSDCLLYTSPSPRD